MVRKGSVRKGLSFLRQFGKMSLTNYFLQSIIGCGLFAYYGSISRRNSASPMLSLWASHGGSAMPLLQPLAQVSLPWSFRGNMEEADLD